MELEHFIRNIPDFPKPGIQFKDITPLLKEPAAFKDAIETISDYATSLAIDAIVGIEARGFLIAAPLAYRLGKPLIPVRKQGKLPYQTTSVTYELEYGSDTVEMHKDAIEGKQRVLIVDDLLATGGTMAATARLIENSGAHVAALVVLIELAGLNGRALLSSYNVHSLMQLSE